MVISRTGLGIESPRLCLLQEGDGGERVTASPTRVTGRWVMTTEGVARSGEEGDEGLDSFWDLSLGLLSEEESSGRMVEVVLAAPFLEGALGDRGVSTAMEAVKRDVDL